MKYPDITKEPNQNESYVLCQEQMIDRHFERLKRLLKFTLAADIGLFSVFGLMIFDFVLQVQRFHDLVAL